MLAQLEKKTVIHECIFVQAIMLAKKTQVSVANVNFFKDFQYYIHCCI